MEFKEEWEQIDIQHCPIKECKGMLLNHPSKHERLCSDCGKMFVQSCKWIEAEDDGKSKN